ncbi:MAG: hypothetical protein IT458_00005 [Planctomycetes bacterium]|nr:hypothetical protein [Planctomycetota bacterium]
MSEPPSKAGGPHGREPGDPHRGVTNRTDAEHTAAALPAKPLVRVEERPDGLALVVSVGTRELLRVPWSHAIERDAGHEAIATLPLPDPDLAQVVEAAELAGIAAGEPPAVSIQRRSSGTKPVVVVAAGSHELFRDRLDPDHERDRARLRSALLDRHGWIWPALLARVEHDLLEGWRRTVVAEDLEVAPATERDRKPLHREAPRDGRPEITVGADLPGIVRGSIEALVRHGSVYVRAGVLVEPGVLEPNPGGTVRRDPQALVAVPLSRGRMREVLAESAAFYGVTREGERYPIQPPPILARELLERGRYEGIPRLEVIASGPYIRGGKLIAVPGFDADSGTLAVFDPAAFPEIPLRPTDPEVREAAQILQEWMVDISFATEGDRTAAIACLIESVVGPSIDGPRPVRCVEASTAGSGKGLFATCCELIGSGVGPAVTAYAEDEELRKTLLGLAVQGDQSILFDNVSGRFGSPILAAAITGRAIKGRLLGGNSVVSAPLRIGWWMTGNNPSFGHDLGRRVLPVRLDPGCMHPEDRSGFKFLNLVEHVRQRRGRYYSAVLVLELAYVQAGRPAHGLPRWGSFESWDDCVRAPMIWAGLGDPLAVRLRLREQADEDLNHLRRLHEVWASRFPSGGTVRDALTRASAGDGDLQDVLAALDERSPGSPSPVRVGRALHRIAGRIIDTYREGRLVSRRRMVDPPGHGGLVVWRVEDLLPRGGDGGVGGVISPYLRPSTETSLSCSGVGSTPPSHPTQPPPDRNGHLHPADGEPDPERDAIASDGAP